MDWETVLKIVGIIVTLLLGLLGLRPEWRKIASTSRFTLKRDLEILELIKRIDKDDPRYETVKKHIDTKVDRMYLPAEQKLSWSILGSLLLFIGFSFWSWYIVKDGFNWWVILTGYIAAAGLYLTAGELSVWWEPLGKFFPVKRVGRLSAPAVIDTFTKFIDDNKDELTALRIIYGKPCSTRYLTQNEVQKIVEVMERPPYKLIPELVWRAAYITYPRATNEIRYYRPQGLLTNVVSLIWLIIGKTDTLEPFPMIVNHRFQNWLKRQEEAGRTFTAEQKEWLDMIKERIATSLSISMDDFESVSFYKKGGAVKANDLFFGQLDKLIEELNEALVA